MTPRVWVERSIESVEDAEALPEGTVAHRVLRFESVTTTLTQPEVAVKVGLNAWDSTAVEAIDKDWLDAHMVGWTALVPVEAEEHRGHFPDGAPAYWYSTPWEPVPDRE